MKNNIGALRKHGYRKSDIDPMFVGYLNLDSDLVQHLASLIAEGQEATLHLIASKECSYDDEAFISIKAMPEAPSFERETPDSHEEF